MNIDQQNIKDHFKGEFLISPMVLVEKLAGIRAYIFDWDGVFNSGTKNANGSSSFNEIDSMGVNMLRFNHFLRTNQNPLCAIITGENNADAYTFAKRENFNAVFFSIKNKPEALHHLCSSNNLQPAEVAYFYDDVLDLSIAGTAGLRIMVGRKCNPFLTEYACTNQLADYITNGDGGNNAIREASELLIGLSERYNETISQRVHNSDNYKQYLKLRNLHNPVFYTINNSVISQQMPL